MSVEQLYVCDVQNNRCTSVLVKLMISSITRSASSCSLRCTPVPLNDLISREAGDPRPWGARLYRRMQCSLFGRNRQLLRVNYGVLYIEHKLLRVNYGVLYIEHMIMKTYLIAYAEKCLAIAVQNSPVTRRTSSWTTLNSRMSSWTDLRPDFEVKLILLSLRSCSMII